jgi:hypothetical protein
MWRIRVNPRKVAHATTRRAQLDTTAIFLPLRQRSWGRGPGRGGAVKMVEGCWLRVEGEKTAAGTSAFALKLRRDRPALPGGSWAGSA